jgi:hypothetical protein
MTATRGSNPRRTSAAVHIVCEGGQLAEQLDGDETSTDPLL